MNAKPEPVDLPVTESGLTPLSIDRVGETAIKITWNDGNVSSWTVAALRQACPCATCREKKASASDEPSEPKEPKSLTLPVISAAEARPLRIESMSPVGQYAYSIEFSDGHSSGIFTFAMLHEPPE
jgi:DUF971 family protein